MKQYVNWICFLVLISFCPSVSSQETKLASSEDTKRAIRLEAAAIRNDAIRNRPVSAQLGWIASVNLLKKGFDRQHAHIVGNLVRQSYSETRDDERPLSYLENLQKKFGELDKGSVGFSGGGVGVAISIETLFALPNLFEDTLSDPELFTKQ